MQGAAANYEHQGATAGEMPAGWRHDEQRAYLGRGDACWQAAKGGLRSWRQFDLGWVRSHDDRVPLEQGALFGFVSRQVGVWAVNVCRIVFVVDEPDRFGFAYGTVGSHVVRGEELFLLERDTVTDEVTFTIRKFSLPAHWLVRLAGPIATSIQRAFTRDALARMQQEVAR
jgi:uncharacterized protein (UPF0548 family)